ncbi:MAG: hypothetical protein EXS35_17975 [Pedosphaera sp.]|nr:hypothetical protein [Pedosphaera sp.]
MKKKTENVEKSLFNSAGYQINMKDLNGEPLPDLEKLAFRLVKHGGTRVGAGRKPSGRKAVLLRLSPKLIAVLRKDALRNHKTLSDVAEERLAQV